MLEQSIKLQCRIIPEQDRLSFEAIHRQAWKGINEQLSELLRELPDNQ